MLKTLELHFQDVTHQIHIRNIVTFTLKIANLTTYKHCVFDKLHIHIDFIYIQNRMCLWKHLIGIHLYLNEKKILDSFSLDFSMNNVS